jgi:hypothetical protein
MKPSGRKRKGEEENDTYNSFGMAKTASGSVRLSQTWAMGHIAPSLSQTR